MHPLAIALRHLRSRPLTSALTTLIIALGVGLAIAVISLGAGLRRGLTTAGGPFELVVGPKGSATQLVVSSVLFQDVPLGNIPYATYERLAQDERVRDAVPLALGDNLQGIRIIGTTPQLFEVAVTPERPPFYRLAAGRVFGQEFEAVLGSAAAARLGMQTGATFESSHGTLGGVNEVGHEGFSYTVVGVLAPTGTPGDLGIYVPLSSYWQVHGEMRGSIFTPGSVVQDDSAASATAVTAVTAVLVRGRDINATYQLYSELNSGNELQAALPGAVLTQFLSWLGQGEQLLAAISTLALSMAALSMALALYAALLARRRDIAVMRALGASRGTVFAVSLGEALLQGLAGALAGLVLGHVAAALAAQAINQQSALATAITFDPLAEAAVLGAMLLLGLIAGLLPAAQAYRMEAAAALG
ncbi:MAG: ABC transporter permease [Roseiflexaceae bacterium]|nr:ABC transporter permease [Roseiflexaceae bacterium]